MTDIKCVAWICIGLLELRFKNIELSHTFPRAESPMTDSTRGYPDLHAHLDALKAQGLLLTIDEPIDKDSELHALVRWQFVGGIEEAERKAFLFTNIVNAHGRRYAMPVVVGAIAANRTIYSIGMGVPVEKIQAKWDYALAHPVRPNVVTKAAC